MRRKTKTPDWTRCQNRSRIQKNDVNIFRTTYKIIVTTELLPQLLAQNLNKPPPRQLVTNVIEVRGRRRHSINVTTLIEPKDETSRPRRRGLLVQMHRIYLKEVEQEEEEQEEEGVIGPVAVMRSVHMWTMLTFIETL